MKIIRSPYFAFLILCLSCLAIGSACSSLQREFLSSPSTNAVTGVITPAVSNVPPVVPQLQEGAALAGATLPAPWGGLVQATLLLLAGGASAFATFHARRAADASQAATTTAAAQASPPSAK